MFEKLCSQLADSLRKMIKQVDDLKVEGDDETAMKICTEFDELINQ